MLYGVGMQCCLPALKIRALNLSTATKLPVKSNLSKILSVCKEKNTPLCYIFNRCCMRLRSVRLSVSGSSPGSIHR